MDKPIAKFRTIFKPSPAKDFYTPNFIGVPTKLYVDEDCFQPVQLPDGYVMVHASKDEIIPSNFTCSLECGIRLSIPAGYRLVGKSLISGLFLKEVFIENERLSVVVTNLASGNIHVQRGQEFAKVGIEPVYIFEFES